MTTPLRINVQYPTRRALLSHARTETSTLSLFVPGSYPVIAGASVTLDITIAGTELNWVLEGKVRLQLSGYGARQDAGLGVVFTGPQKRQAAEMLAACAGRAPDAGTALDSRHEVEVRCLVNLHGKKVRGSVRDVSSTGAFIRAPQVAAMRGNAELTIQLDPLFGLWGGRVLKARVVWVGEKKGMVGFGVRFLDATTFVRESLKSYFPANAS
jgi:hypothetical protein